MKPVPQKVLVSPGIRGDCFRACVASILELSSDDVPHFVAIEKDWWGETQKWLAGRGLFALWLMTDELLLAHPCGEIYCILTGPSPRGGGLQHSVVGKIDDGWNLIPVYDPHPSGEMLSGRATSVLFFCSILDGKQAALK